MYGVIIPPGPGQYISVWYRGIMPDQLSAKDWLDQGLKTLAANGAGALKADPLAKALGVSRGSFYWHFADVAAFRTAMLAYWREVSAERVIADLEAGAEHENPLLLLLRRTFSSRLTLEKAVRSWATFDGEARIAVQAIDRRRMRVNSNCRASPMTSLGLAPKSSIGHLSAMRSPTSSCRKRNRRPCTTNSCGSRSKTNT